MRRELRLRSEVFGGLHQSRAEEPFPGSIDPDARCEWMRRVNKPLSEAESIAWRSLGQRRQRRGQAGRDFVGSLVVLTAHENEGLARIRQFAHHHHAR